MTKINFVINNLKVGGAEKVVTDLCNEFDINYDVEIITLHKNKLNLNLPSHIVLTHLENYNYISKIIHIYKKNKQKNSITISFLPLSNILCIISNFFSKGKLIISVRNDLKLKPTSKKIFFLSRILYRFSNLTICQTEKIYQTLKNDYNVNKCKIIPNYVNQHSLIDNCESTKKYFDDEKVNFISVGTKFFQKGFDEIIKTFQKIDSSFKNYRLIIVGVDLNDLKNNNFRIDNLDNIFFTGLIGNVNDFYSKSNYYILGSRYEGFSNTMIEAINFGVFPILKEDVSGVTEIKKNLPETICFKNFNELQSIIEEILLNNKKQTFSKNDLIKFKNKYSKLNILKLWDDQIQNLLNET